jgi:hypothetical protein
MSSQVRSEKGQSVQNNLIWLVGLPRSGTSWLGKIFDSHPATGYRSEPDNFPKLNGIPLFPDRDDEDRYHDAMTQFVVTLPRLSAYRFAAKPPLFPKSYRSSAHEYSFRAAAFVARVGSRINADFPVLGARADRLRPAPILVWKSINSLGRFGLVLRSAPMAKAIHLVRHPCGHIASVLRGEKQADSGDAAPHSEWYGVFGALLRTPQAQRRGLTLDGLRALAPEQRLAWHWLLVNEKAIEEDGERARLLRYEDLCQDPLAIAHDLFEFTGLAWNEQTEEFLNQSTSTNNRKYFSVFKDPAKAASRWREELSPDCVDRIMAVVSQSDRLSKLYPPA